MKHTSFLLSEPPFNIMTTSHNTSLFASLFGAVLLLLLTGCASTGTMTEAEVNRDYDSVEDLTYYTHTPVMLKNYGLDGSPSVFMQTIVTCEGEVQDCPDGRYALLFTVEGERLSDSYSLTLRLGDRRIRPQRGDYNANTGRVTTFSEGFSFLVSEQDVRELARLPEGEVEGRLAGINLEMTYERRKAVRMLVSRLEEVSSPEKESTEPTESP